ncbi:MAG TPA: class I SAM-dependent methyltransferase [Pyrinomonadaceae bacterium]|jgi:ubiquinone/menaquinone biosynthesis C-methylase UbiE
MSEKLKNLYVRAGIEDIAEFYRTRYVSEELLDARYFDALNRFDIRWARTLWVYDNVRPGAKVLDLGCGGGTLALLKRKGVTLYGVDISADCAAISKRNGYDATCVARLTALPFADATFDAVASLDVMGHIEFEEKDSVLSEISRVLRRGGVTLHGIECLDRSKRKDYDEMDAEELRRFISIDGHVGMEDEHEIAARFRRFFKHVRAEPRYAVCQSQEELLKQADEYGTPLCDPDFLEYLRGMSFKERRAFNLAMGYVFEKISEQEISLPRSEYLLLKASDAPLGSFYKEHGDRSQLFPAASELASPPAPLRLDHSTHARFDGGWYEAEMFPPVARWMGRRARINFKASACSKLRLDVTTHMPELDQRPLALEFFLNGERVLSLSLIRHGWLELEMQAAAQNEEQSRLAHSYELEIRASRTWQPRPDDAQRRDDRELSVAVCNIEILP